MSQSNPSSGGRTFTAGADFSVAGQFYLVKLDTSNEGNILLATSAADPIIGVLMNAPKAGQEARVHMNMGTAKVIMSAACNVGDWITSDGSTGKGVATTTDKDCVIGRALEAAGADGDIIEVAMMPHKLSI